MDQGSSTLERRCLNCNHFLAQHDPFVGCCLQHGCGCQRFDWRNEDMTPEQWCEQVTQDAGRTDLEHQMYPDVVLRIANPRTLAALCCSMRTYIYFGDQLNDLKRHLFYGKPLPEYMTNIEPYENAAPLDQLSKTETIQLLHAAIGVGTESAEILEQMCNHIFMGKELDHINLVEEYGDVSWYIRLAAIVLKKVKGMGFFEMIMRNIAKLKIRYPDKFTAENALNRDLNAERKLLES